MVVALQDSAVEFPVDHLAEPGHPAGPSPIILIGNADGAFQPQVLYAVEFTGIGVTAGDCKLALVL
jgi:hypothetical protein